MRGVIMSNYKELQNGSDIRGTALPGVPGEEVNLTPEAVKMLTAGFAVRLSKKTGKPFESLTLAVGRDPRLSGDALAGAAAETARSLGIRVLDCGLASTPAMFMATVFPEFRADGSVMVTASHLPFNKNGLKFFSASGGLDKEDISAIIETAENIESPRDVLKSSVTAECTRDPRNTGNISEPAENITKQAENLQTRGKTNVNTSTVDENRRISPNFVLKPEAGDSKRRISSNFDCMKDTADENRRISPESVLEPGAGDSKRRISPNSDCMKDTADENRRISPESVSSAEKIPLMTVYAKHLRTLIADACASGGLNREKPLAGLRICVDAGNGSGGFYAGDVLAPLGADVSSGQFLTPDGHFPNHAPNPENKAAMDSITRRVKETGADLGLIFDTDVDRSSAVDENGREINRNGIVALAAALIAEDHPGTTIVTDSITSNELTDFLEKDLCVKHLRYKRGYRNVINKGLELNACGTDCQLAIETSGHAAYKENYFLDDGAFLATKIVIKTALLHKEGKGISSVTCGLAEPAESVEIRMPILSKDFRAAGDEILHTVEKWIRENGDSCRDFLINSARKSDAEQAPSHDIMSTADTPESAEHSSGYVGNVPASVGNPPAYIKEKPGSVESPQKTVEIAIVEPNYEGVRVSFSGDLNGWFLLRKSLHDPIMPLNIEAEETGGTRMIANMLYECLGKSEALDASGLKAV